MLFVLIFASRSGEVESSVPVRASLLLRQKCELPYHVAPSHLGDAASPGLL